MTQPLVVHTDQGELSGVELDGALAWRGIPYAVAPTGPRRWRAPEPPTRWDGVRDAGIFSARAMQPTADDASRSYSEDCLYLNVCAPAGSPPPRGWPVLVWVHGGGFMSDTHVDPGEGVTFAHDGLIVVTFNYRLGAFGFLHLAGVFGDHELDAGVCGLLDQIAALKWVKANIANFGGDRDAITLYGESAGAKSVANLLASPLTRGFATRAISSSGGADHIATPQGGTRLARRFLDALAMPRASAKELRALPSKDILAAEELLGTGVSASWIWRPTMHPGVLPGVALELISAGSAAGVDLLIGSNGNEAAFFAAHAGAAAAAAPTRTVLADIVGPDHVDELLAVYRRSRHLTDETAIEIAVMGDERYGVSTQHLADAQTAHATVWRYRFDATAPGRPETLAGAHGTDIPHVWKLPPPTTSAADPQLHRLSDQMHTAWVAFAAGLPPAAPGLPQWPTYDTEDRPVLILDRTSRVELDPRRDERLAWHDKRWVSSTWFPTPKHL